MFHCCCTAWENTSGKMMHACITHSSAIDVTGRKLYITGGESLTGGRPMADTQVNNSQRTLLQCVSRVWACLTWLKFVMVVSF